ncbi:hypothetical protein NUW58_g7889 [Xylaria curta]|uniref:Uncharacterized protein n=1 Tax=Xylaria curta TaxID=42375 RepID=A0ACC1NEA4_9PEZI|nr:hypothetical protein NUW58_g7889 [Xylaria curta]
MECLTLGKARAYWLGSVVCLGGFLFGYDSGIVGGVLTLASFQDDYHYDSSAGTRTNSLSVGLQQLGGFVACFLAWPLADKLGRKKALMLSSAVFIIGAIIQTINTHSLAAFYIARVIAGLGLGAATVVVPMFNSEMMPKEMRGQVGSFFQWFFTFGIFVSYFVDYGVARAILNNQSSQWQIPIGLQILPAGILGLGMLTLPESTRWLTKKGRHDEAWESLQWIRADSSQTIVDEMEGIRVGVKTEARATEGFQFKELLQSENFKRVIAAFAIFTAQQATGATAFAYFGPQYFKLIVGSGDRSLLITAIFGAVKVVACGIFILWFSERLSRRQVLIGGAVVMSACQITTAAVVKFFPAPAEQEEAVSPPAIATIALIYLFVVAYNFSWGPMPWPYVSEIFSARIREPGIAVGVASQWLWNLIFSLTTPYMIASLGWGTFLIWGIFDLVIAVFTFFFLKETRGLSLEHIAHSRFRANSSSEGSAYHNYSRSTSFVALPISKAAQFFIRRPTAKGWAKRPNRDSYQSIVRYCSAHAFFSHRYDGDLNHEALMKPLSRIRDVVEMPGVTYHWVLLTTALLPAVLALPNSTYTNPILPGFHPDPSCIFVPDWEDTFFCASSSFNAFPGIPLHASKDLQNWKLIGHVLNRREQLPRLTETNRSTSGIWAPTLRYNEKTETFWLVTTLVDDDRPDTDASRWDNVIFKSKDPFNPTSWSKAVHFDFQGYDTSPVWDFDGKTYIVGGHAWRVSPGIMLAEANLDTGKVGEWKKIWDGTGGSVGDHPDAVSLFTNGAFRLPKVHISIAKMAGLTSGEGGTGLDHMVTMARSKGLYGPYESNPANPVLTNANTTEYFQTVGHADLFQDSSKNWWGVALSTRSGPEYLNFPMVRETVMVPVTWQKGKFPVWSPVKGVMNGWPMPKTTKKIPGSSPFTTEGDVIDFEPRTTLPAHFTHWRYPILESPKRKLRGPGRPDIRRPPPARHAVYIQRGHRFLAQGL